MQSKMHNTCVLKIVVVLLSDGYMFTKIGFRVVHGINLGRGFEHNLSADSSVFFQYFCHICQEIFSLDMLSIKIRKPLFWVPESITTK